MPNDELIGKRVKFRSSIWGNVQGRITGIQYEPCEVGYRPSMTANILLDDGRIGTEYLHGCTVLPEPVQEPADEQAAVYGATPFRVTFTRMDGGRYMFMITNLSGVIRCSGGADNYDHVLGQIRQNLGDQGYL